MQLGHPPSPPSRGIFGGAFPLAAYTHRTKGRLYASSNKTSTTYDLVPSTYQIDHQRTQRGKSTTREESEVFERQKVDETNRTLLEPYFRHIKRE